MREATLYILIAVTVALALYDLAVVIRSGPAASISAVLFVQCRTHPIIAFVLGVLIGHVLWPNVR